MTLFLGSLETLVLADIARATYGRAKVVHTPLDLIQALERERYHRVVLLDRFGRDRAFATSLRECFPGVEICTPRNTNAALEAMACA